MSNINIVLLVIGVTLGIGLTILVLFPLLKKKGVNTQDVLEKTDKVLEATDGVLKVADTLFPNNPAINILKVIDNYVHKGVTGAEQMSIASQLPADQRNAKAKELIYSALKVLGIEATPEIDKIIDGTIESEVLALGHTPADVKQIQDTNTQLQASNTELQTQNSQLQSSLQQLQSTQQTIQSENDTLKQKIATIQNAVA